MTPFFEAWFFWCGVVLTGILGIGILWLLNYLLFWPIVEAFSITRCVVKSLGGERVNNVCIIWLGAFLDCVGGRDWDSVSNNKFQWRGVGNWTIYEEHEDE